MSDLTIEFLIPDDHLEGANDLAVLLFPGGLAERVNFIPTDFWEDVTYAWKSFRMPLEWWIDKVKPLFDYRDEGAQSMEFILPDPIDETYACLNMPAARRTLSAMLVLHEVPEEVRPVPGPVMMFGSGLRWAYDIQPIPSE